MTTRFEPSGPLTKTTLVEAVAAELGIPLGEAQDHVHAVLNVITRTLAAGHSVTVTNFGAWDARMRPEHTARNPQTGGRVHVPARRRARFAAAERLQDTVAAGDTTATIRKRPSRKAITR